MEGRLAPGYGHEGEWRFDSSYNHSPGTFRRLGESAIRRFPLAPGLYLPAVEVTGVPGFRNYEETLFRDGTFIWTNNLELDNRVVCRTTVESAP